MGSCGLRSEAFLHQVTASLIRSFDGDYTQIVSRLRHLGIGLDRLLEMPLCYFQVLLFRFQKSHVEIRRGVVRRYFQGLPQGGLCFLVFPEPGMGNGHVDAAHDPPRLEPEGCLITGQWPAGNCRH